MNDGNEKIGGGRRAIKNSIDTALEEKVQKYMYIALY